MTRLLYLCLLVLVACGQPAAGPWVITAPADTAYCRLDPAGTSIIPNGRRIRPWGRTLPLAPHPYGLTLSPDGQVAITANSGTRPFSISLIRDVLGPQPQVQQIPEGPLNDEDLLSAVFMGLAVSPDQQTVYAAGGEANVIYRFALADGAPLAPIPCGSGPEAHGYIGDMVLSGDGRTLYAVDQIGFSLLIIDTEAGAVRQRVPVGRYPFGVCLSPDETRVYVANVGVFAYTPIPGLTPENAREKGLRYPAFGYNSPEMREGVVRDSLAVPGLGDPNAPESFSVWAVDLRADSARVVKKIKTGILVGEMVEGIPAVGGASPNSLVATATHVYVSNGNNDCISVIDLAQDTVVENIALQPDPRLGHWRGVIPFGLALDPAGERLFVAEAGLNAVGVIDLQTRQVLGHIPVGWFPAKVAVSPDGRQLVVANAKGYGSGPNGGAAFDGGPGGSSYIGHLMRGSLTVLDIPEGTQLTQATAEVLANNFTFTPARQVKQPAGHPLPRYSGERPSPIEYIVFISKENRTYDEVFGQLEKGRGDPSLARYGWGATFTNAAGQDTVVACDVMANHLALAQRFAIADNFYVDSDHSADGHRWLVNTYPNEWVETHVSAAYGGRRGMRSDSEAPGNWALVGASGAIYPEDYNEHGAIWDHLDRHQVSFFNFGFGTEMAGSLADSTMKYTGIRYLVNFPLPGPLYDRSSRQYPTYNMAIPDQFRVDQFLREWKEKGWDDGQSLPQVLTILLPNDHGAGDRPHAGYPYRESYMIDNDLALGRLVEFLSHSPYWDRMAIFVTEDDSQNGVDHVDAHRSLLMVISPWARRGHISHVHYSFGSIFKTFWDILGLPYLNHYDATATHLADLFGPTPDLEPFNALPPDLRAFDPQAVLDPFDEAFDWEAVVASPGLDDPAVLEREAAAADSARAREQERNQLSNPRGE